MMKGPLLLGMLLLPAMLLAQPIISLDNFPQSGDTLYYLTDELPERIAVSPPGPDQKWNYTTLQAPFIEFEVVQPASSGRRYNDYPASDLVLRSSRGLETYLQISGTRVILVGQAGTLFKDLRKLKGNMKWTGELPEVVSNLKYEDDVDFNATGEIRLGRLQIPLAYSDAIGGDPDSILIRRQVARRITADAWGQLLLPGGLFDVLRVRYVDEIATTVSARYGRHWQDVTNRLPSELLGATREISYRFFSPQGQQVVTLYTDEGEIVQHVEYMAPRAQAGFYQRPRDGQWLYAFPNPAITNVRFKFLDIAPGEYSIRFYNILGKTLFDRRYLINGSKTVQIDISHLDKGTYLYSLLDKNGNKLITKRLIIVKP